MDDASILGQDEYRMLKQFMAQYDAPAYVRRARQVQGALEALIDRCRRQRDEWLFMVRTRLGVLHGLAGDWDRLVPLLSGADQVDALRRLHDILSPQLRVPVEPTSSPRALRRAVRELQESIERFNRRWQEFLRGMDLAEINRLRDGYNRYFLLEKECAVRSYRVASMGFRPLKPLTRDELAEMLPELPVPRLRD